MLGMWTKVLGYKEAEIRWTEDLGVEVGGEMS